jgi:hypothetical protein
MKMFEITGSGRGVSPGVGGAAGCRGLNGVWDGVRRWVYSQRYVLFSFCVFISLHNPANAWETSNMRIRNSECAKIFEIVKSVENIRNIDQVRGAFIKYTSYIDDFNFLRDCQSTSIIYILSEPALVVIVSTVIKIYIHLHADGTLRGGKIVATWNKSGG